MNIKDKIFGKKEMKLGISYNLFDGEELLEASLRSVREEAYHISVVWQKTSYYGNPCSEGLEALLNSLKEKGLIDTLYCYETDLNKYSRKPRYERRKRNIGLTIAKKAGCTHFLSMDVDEFYNKEQLKQAKEYIIQNGITTSACSIVEYMTQPIYKIINGYTYSPSKDYNFYLPFITKINKIFPQKHGYGKYPCFTDPTRRLHSKGRFYLFPSHVVAMHHMANIRKDLEKKYENSNYNSQANAFQDEVAKLRYEIPNWDFEKNRLGESKYSLFGDKVVEKVENIFNIFID